MAGHLEGAVDPSHQPAQHAAGRQFMQSRLGLVRERGEQSRARLAPSYGRDQLLDEPLPEKFRVVGVMRLGGHVRPDRHSQRGDLDLVERLGEPVRGRLHERTVERPRDLQWGGSNSLVRGDLNGAAACVEVARQHDLAGRVEVRADQDAVPGRLAADRLGLDLVGTDQGDHAASAGFRGLLHQASTEGDQPKSVDEAEGAGEVQGGVLAKGESGRGDDSRQRHLLQHALP